MAQGLQTSCLLGCGSGSECDSDILTHAERKPNTRRALVCIKRTLEIPKEQAGGGDMTQEQAKKKAWLQRCLHETQKLEAMTLCGKYTEQECSKVEQAVHLTEREIKCCIADLTDPELEAVLIRRYISFQSWDQIAEEMHYSVRTILRRHTDALEKLSLNGTCCH